MSTKPMEFEIDDDVVTSYCNQQAFESGHEQTDEVTLINREWGFRTGAKWQFTQMQSEIERKDEECWKHIMKVNEVMDELEAERGNNIKLQEALDCAKEVI